MPLVSCKDDAIAILKAIYWPGDVAVANMLEHDQLWAY